MNEKNYQLASHLIPKTYVSQGCEAIKRREKQVTELLSNRKIPENGWNDQSIEYFLQDLAMMDSNNFLNNSGVGEREGRVESDLVARRHYYLAHGIGRAGDVAAVQPKAAGSSLICELTRKLAVDFIKTCGITEVSDCIVLPLATGMSLTMCLLSMHLQHPSAKYVIWFRVDQKTCLKSIQNTGLIPIILEPLLDGDELKSNVDGLKKVLEEYPKEDILCVIPTTSVFAPRLPDDIVSISRICKDHDVAVIVNNAYGLQSTMICQSLNKALRVGRVDVIVSSTDKNLLVPVGGAFVYCKDNQCLNNIRKNYPGRANMSPILDVFITLLSMGRQRILHYLKEREELYRYMVDQLSVVAEKYHQKVLTTPNNPISIAVTLDYDEKGSTLDDDAITRFGSMLYMRGVSGARCVAHHMEKSVGNITFRNYGAHLDNYPYAYFTAAAAIGITKADVDTFIGRLDKNWKEYLKEIGKGAEKKEA